MRSSTLLGFIAPAATLAHVVRERAFGCGAPEPTEQQLQVSAEFAKQEKAVRSAGGVMRPQEVWEVDTVFHVVSVSEEEDEGYISDEILAAQLDVMNADYADSNVQFVLKNTTRTIDRTWARDAGEVAMKTALRQGDYSTLNIYFLSYLSGLLGYCYFPTDAAPGSRDFILDGCSVLFTTLPNGTETNYDLGRTATHEIGHWMGLFHTFQGGCFGGDEVADTPAQSSPTSGCPVGRDSCPTEEGLDPIHNFMDYSYDSCYEEFTPGQADRMWSSWVKYRMPKAGEEEAGEVDED